MALLKAFALFAMATLTAAFSAHAETWRISALDWPPYSSPQEKGGGSAVAVLRASLAEIGVTLEIDYMSFPRAKALAKSGQYIGYFPAWPEEIIEGFKGSRPIMMSQVGVVHRQDSSVSWRNTHDLFENYPTRLGMSGALSTRLKFKKRSNTTPPRRRAWTLNKILFVCLQPAG